jgi:uncharacterized protein YndB with AHSA1/START domain
MKKDVEKKPAPGMSDDAVRAKTGKTWPEWFAILDAAGGKTMTHKEIVAVLGKKYNVGSWWQQMVTVGYERARGLREVHQTSAGYQISVSRTVNVPVSRLYHSWEDPKARSQWLPEADLVVRKATKDKSMRITWTDHKTSVEVGFIAKGDTKSQVAVQHSKLPDAKAVERMKAYWGKMLDGLKGMLEG